jgi:hypothetical protein
MYALLGEFCVSVVINRPYHLHPEKGFEGYPVKSAHIFIGCYLRFLRGSFYPDFFQGGSLKKVGCFTYKSEKNQVSTLKKIWVDDNLKKISGGTLQISSQGAN